jgi:hypothetical protein
MDNIVRNVRDIDTGDRHALEHVVGQSLGDNQTLIIQIVSSESTGSIAPQDAGAHGLPPWCNVYEGLSDDEIAEVEKIALMRADLTRPTE